MSKIYEIKMTPRFGLPNRRFKNGGATADGIVKFLFQITSDYPFKDSSRWEWSCDRNVDIEGVTFHPENFGDTIFVGFNSDDMKFSHETDRGIVDCFKVKGTFRNDGRVTVRAKREGMEIKSTISMSQLLAAKNDNQALAMNYEVVTITDDSEPEAPTPGDIPIEDVLPTPDDLWGRVKDWFKDLFDRYTTITCAVCFVAGVIVGAKIW